MELHLSLFFFLEPHPQHTVILRLGVELELEPLAYNTATAMPDLRRVCDLHHRSQQHWILNPLSEARNRTFVLMDTVGLITTEPGQEVCPHLN